MVTLKSSSASASALGPVLNGTLHARRSGRAPACLFGSARRQLEQPGTALFVLGRRDLSRSVTALENLERVVHRTSVSPRHWREECEERDDQESPEYPPQDVHSEPIAVHEASPAPSAAVAPQIWTSMRRTHHWRCSAH